MFISLSATVRLHVAYVGSDYYPLNKYLLNILGSKQDILLEERGMDPYPPHPPGALLDSSSASRRL